MTAINTKAPRPVPTQGRHATPRTGHVVLLLLGVLLATFGLVLTGAAAALGVVVSQRSSGGYVSSSTERYAVDSYAITSEQLDVVLDQGLPSSGFRWPDAGVVLRASSGVGGADVFVGVAPQADVTRYLEEVEHAELTQIRFDPFRPSYRTSTGSRAPAVPGVQDFWTVSAQGPGTQQLEFPLRSGNWALVVMNADGSRPVAVNLQAGVRSSAATPVTTAGLVGGLVLLALGIALVVVGASGLGAGTSSTSRTSAVPTGAGPDLNEPAAAPLPAAATRASTSLAYPARLSGELAPQLSRWLWLVKWVLAVPHYIVLVFLWCAFVVSTVAAGLAILVTGRYPRGLFDFNVGVLRWSWRVGFYASAALGTDRYPPFTLERTDYPAEFDVDYPEHLSRGLVLVKSWLLAIPHLIIVGLFSGNILYWWSTRGSWTTNDPGTAGISLLGLLVVVAGFFLLITREYPRALFDLVLGLNRWQYRVITYVALMRDEYPPFHLDQGGRDVGVGVLSSTSPLVEPDSLPATR
jgi:hypothetical protein